MRVIIDRFEEEYAIIELGDEMLTVPRALFGDAQEGDHVEITVLGKPQNESGGSQPDEDTETASAVAVEAEAAVADETNPDADPHSIFERLRAKRK